jgi:predicted peptidase
MKQAILLVLFFVLTVFACQKPDEIVPVRPGQQVQGGTPEAAEGPVVLDYNSDSYQYGRYLKMPYRILLPRNYDSTISYPLHVFLHGIGESGTDNEKQLTVGASVFQSDSIRTKYPAIIVFPQCPASHRWYDENTTGVVTGLIDSLIETHTVDVDKITISGFSMGAFGTCAMVAHSPGLFAAAIAISGAGDEHEAYLMAKPKWRFFAGKKDDVVPSLQSEEMVKALKKAGATVSFTAYPETTHKNTWVKAFSEPDFFYWLFSVPGNK